MAIKTLKLEESATVWNIMIKQILEGEITGRTVIQMEH